MASELLLANTETREQIQFIWPDEDYGSTVVIGNNVLNNTSPHLDIRNIYIINSDTNNESPLCQVDPHNYSFVPDLTGKNRDTDNPKQFQSSDGGYVYGTVSTSNVDIIKAYGIETSTGLPYMIEFAENYTPIVVHYVDIEGNWQLINISENNESVLEELSRTGKAIVTPNNNLIYHIADKIANNFSKPSDRKHFELKRQTPQIVHRVAFEGRGREGSWHSESHGATLLNTKRDQTTFTNHSNNMVEPSTSIHNIITSYNERALLTELEHNIMFAQLAMRWGIDDVDYEKLVYACYGTSGTEMNAKELMQLIALASMTKEAFDEQNKEQGVGAFYFIDTSSHPMSQQLDLEAKMYAASTDHSEEEVILQYRSLFSNHVNTGYIDKTIKELESLGVSEDIINKVQANWNERIDNLEIPGDAIEMPDLYEYETFYDSLGIHEKVKDTLRQAYKIIEERELPNTVGTLRCIQYSLLSRIINEQLNIDIPLFTVPVSEIAQALGLDKISMRDFKSLVSEFVMGSSKSKRAYFNVLDPISMGELPLYTSGNGNGLHKSELTSSTDLQKSSDDLFRKKYVEAIEQLPYGTASTIGHNSGMGHYELLQEIGQQNSVVMVLDNYEADDPHQILYSDTRRRMTGNTKYTLLPRGWLRMKKWFGDEDSTYGASPMLDIVTHGLLSDTDSTVKLKTYIDIMKKNTGENATTFLDIDTEQGGTTVGYVYDNYLLTQQIEKKGSVSAIEIAYQKALTIQHETAAQQIATDEEVSLFNQFTILNFQLQAVNRELENKSEIFSKRSHQGSMLYFENRIQAIMKAARELGLPTYDNDPDLQPRALLTTHDNDVDIKNLSESLYSNYLSVIKKTTPETVLTVDDTSIFYEQYEKSKQTQDTTTRYREAQNDIKILNSIIDMYDKNPDIVVVAVQKLDEKLKPDQETSQQTSSQLQLNADENNQITRRVNSVVDCLKYILKRGIVKIPPIDSSPITHETNCNDNNQNLHPGTLNGEASVDQMITDIRQRFRTAMIRQIDIVDILHAKHKIPLEEGNLHKKTLIQLEQETSENIGLLAALAQIENQIDTESITTLNMARSQSDLNKYLGEMSVKLINKLSIPVKTIDLTDQKKCKNKLLMYIRKACSDAQKQQAEFETIVRREWENANASSPATAEFTAQRIEFNEIKSELVKRRNSIQDQMDILKPRVNEIANYYTNLLSTNVVIAKQ